MKHPVLYYYWVEKDRSLYGGHRYVEIRNIEVPLIKNRGLRFPHKSFKSEWVWQIVDSYLCLYMLALFSIYDTILPKEILGNIFCVYECMCMYLQRSQIEIVVLLHYRNWLQRIYLEN